MKVRYSTIGKDNLLHYQTQDEVGQKEKDLERNQDGGEEIAAGPDLKKSRCNQSTEGTAAAQQIQHTNYIHVRSV